MRGRKPRLLLSHLELFFSFLRMKNGSILIFYRLIIRRVSSNLENPWRSSSLIL